MRFNPRAREGRDSLHRQIVPSLHVSIHAPARGATPDSCHKHVTFEFQSTRPQGARPGRMSSSEPAICFNPRARKGRDETHEYRVGWVYKFQSTRPQGARHTSADAPRLSHKFQSTRPQGARPESIRDSQPSSCFNPRARKGRDFAAITYGGEIQCFNPRARKGRDSF